MMILSNGRRKIKLVNQPHQLCESLTAVLHDSFPRRVRSASWDDNDMYTIEMSGLDFNSKTYKQLCSFTFTDLESHQQGSPT